MAANAGFGAGTNAARGLRKPIAARFPRRGRPRSGEVMKAKHMVVLSILACGACDGAPDDGARPAADTNASVGREGEPISEVQSNLDTGCFLATPTPNFWAAVKYISSDKIHVPV